MSDSSIKREVLDWLNNLLEVNITKLEDAASGALACQLLDVLYPNRVPMSKINWNAKEPHEFLPNYKILITCLADLRIDKSIDLNKMIHADVQDLLHWFKAKYESLGIFSAGEYDCFMQRSKGKGGNTYPFSVKQRVKSSSRNAPIRKPSQTTQQFDELNESNLSNHSLLNSSNEISSNSPLSPSRTPSSPSKPPSSLPKSPSSTSMLFADVGATPNSFNGHAAERVSELPHGECVNEAVVANRPSIGKKMGIPAPIPRTTAAAAIRMAASRAKTPPPPPPSLPSKPVTHRPTTTTSRPLPTTSAPPTRPTIKRSATAPVSTTRALTSRGSVTTPSKTARGTTQRPAPVPGRGVPRGRPVKLDPIKLQKELLATKKALEDEKVVSAAYKQDSDGLTKERDFYFDKLRAIEIFIQEYQESGKGNECSATVLRIMYATQEGFVTSDEDALAAVLSEAAVLIGPDAVAAAASAEQYVKRRASFTSVTEQ